MRKKLDLDQRDAAEIFGGGVNAFSRYENGKIRPPLALVKLFKLLDRHPDLLDEVKAFLFLFIIATKARDCGLFWFFAACGGASV